MDKAVFFLFSFRPLKLQQKQKEPHSHAVPEVLNLVGAARFELTASCTRNKRATKLRHAPTFVVAVHQQRM